MVDLGCVFSRDEKQFDADSNLKRHLGEVAVGYYLTSEYRESQHDNGGNCCGIRSDVQFGGALLILRDSAENQRVVDWVYCYQINEKSSRINRRWN